MNKQVFKESLKYIFLPTLFLYVFLAVNFWSFIDPFKYAFSNQIDAIVMRDILFLIEIGLFITIYAINYLKFKHDRDKEIIAKTQNDPKIHDGESGSEAFSTFSGLKLHRFFDYSSNYYFEIFKTESRDVIVIKRSRKPYDER